MQTASPEKSSWQDNNSQFDYIVSALPGIVIATVAYAVILFAILPILFGGGFLAFSGAPEWEFLLGTGVAFGMVIGVGFFLGWLVGGICLMLAAFFNWSLGNVIRPRVVICCVAGLTGFLLTLPVFFGAENLMEVVRLTLFTSLFGPVLAVGVFTICADFHERRVLRINQIQPDLVRMGTRSYLILAFWVSVLLAMINAISHWIPITGPLVMTYVVLQTLFLIIVWLFSHVAGRIRNRSRVTA